MDHIEWARTVPRALAHNLADSAVATPDLEGMGLPFRAAFPGRDDALLERLEVAWGQRLGAPEERIIVTAGASEANAVVFLGLLEPGDEVLVESPGYEPHRLVPQWFGAAVRTFRRAPGTDLCASVEAALGPATRMVVVSDLHNPSGTALTSGEAHALNALAERRGLWILCDETFRDADDRPCGSWSTLGPRWIATTTLTKVYGLGPLRLGCVAGSHEARARCAHAHHALSAEPAQPSVALALDLVPHLDALRARARGILAENQARWTHFVATRPMFRSGLVRGTTTFCLFDTPGAGDAFARHAAERFDLAVVPGRFFGEPRGVRIALGGLPHRFATALDVLGRAVDTFAPQDAEAGEPA